MSRSENPFDPPGQFPAGTDNRRPATDLRQGDSREFQLDLVNLERSFERALESMSLSFQPIVSAEDHHLVGYEALLRPNDPDLPHPGAMLDAAERLQRLEKLSRTIRGRVAARCASATPERGLFFVNLHALDLLDRSLSSPYSPLAKVRERVVLEVTERASLEGLDDVRYRVAELREMGYRIAIDDLGAGHARMKQFTPLDTDYVKLDMSLVRNIEQSVVNQQLVSSITLLCRDHGIGVVGEGVETEAERETLLELGCDLLQGFLIARPDPRLVDVEPAM